MKKVLLGLIAALATAASAQASTLIYQASFSVTLTSWDVMARSGIDLETGERVPFNPADYSAGALGLGLLEGKEIGDSWTGGISVFSTEASLARSYTDRISLECYGSLMRCAPYPDAIDMDSDLRSISFMYHEFVYDFRIGPEGGFYNFINDGNYSGTIDGISWMTFSGGGMNYSLALSDVRVLMPAPAIPLPAGATLLGGALALLALRRRGAQPVQNSVS